MALGYVLHQPRHAADVLSEDVDWRIPDWSAGRLAYHDAVTVGRMVTARVLIHKGNSRLTLLADPFGDRPAACVSFGSTFGPHAMPFMSP